MLLDFLKPPPIEDDIPEEVETEEESRYQQYRPNVYDFDTTDWQKLEAEDKEALKRVRGLKIIPKKEWWGMKLEINRLRREREDLKTRVNVSADKKFQDEAILIRDKFYELLGQSVKDAALIDTQIEQLNLKDETIEKLRQELVEQKERYEQQISSLMTVNSSLAINKAVQRSVLHPETIEDNPKAAHQFVSATGRTAAENKAICYWLLKAGKTVEEVQKLSGIKSAQAYAKQGEAILKKQNVNLDIDGFIRTCPVTELNSNGYHPDYPGVEPTGYSFPRLVMDTLWK